MRCAHVRFNLVSSRFNHHARLLEHEYDDLDGIFYAMRMDDMSSLSFANESGPPPLMALPRTLDDFVDPACENVG